VYVAGRKDFPLSSKTSIARIFASVPENMPSYVGQDRDMYTDVDV
jgi:hypothetical protein